MTSIDIDDDDEEEDENDNGSLGSDGYIDMDGEGKLGFEAWMMAGGGDIDAEVGGEADAAGKNPFAMEGEGMVSELGSELNPVVADEDMRVDELHSTSSNH